MNTKKWILAWIIAVGFWVLWLLFKPFVTERQRQVDLVQKIGDWEKENPLIVIQCGTPDGASDITRDPNPSPLSALEYSKGKSEGSKIFESNQTDLGKLKDQATAFYPNPYARALLKLRHTAQQCEHRYLLKFADAEILLFTMAETEDSIRAYFVLSYGENSSAGTLQANSKAFKKSPCLVGRELISSVLAGKQIKEVVSPSEPATNAPRRIRVIGR
jgi:hypothetical protein